LQARSHLTRAGAAHRRLLLPISPEIWVFDYRRGHCLIEAGDLNDAIHVASKIPPAREEAGQEIEPADISLKVEGPADPDREHASGV